MLHFVLFCIVMFTIGRMARIAFNTIRSHRTMNTLRIK